MAGAPLRNPQWGNEAFALRYKQIDSLRQYFPTLKEVAKDSVYEIAITLPSRKTINLRIILGQDFPYQAPGLQITPQVVQHRFVNDQMYVMPQMHEKLATWNLHTNLGKTVYEISQKLIQDQPQVLTSQPAPSTSSYGGYPNTGEPPPPYGVYGPSTTPSRPAQNPPNASPVSSSNISSSSSTSSTNLQIRTPAIPSSFPELDQKSITELTDLLNNEDVFQALFDSLEIVKTMQKLRDDLRDGNEEIAKKNVECTTEVDSLHTLLNSKKDSLQQLRVAVEQKTMRQQAIMQQLSPTILVERLADAAAVADSESEEIASSFLDGISEREGKKRGREQISSKLVFNIKYVPPESAFLSFWRCRFAFLPSLPTIV
eukprot:Phypoly_transcript_10270.p1 GENE.Phypoly_transcript_10270~~Phypoly_transcript_10270.p1  ORF type:complete len:372 (+),score=72.82 Phypoly_transcript_10270:49-1164(+)